MSKEKPTQNTIAFTQGYLCGICAIVKMQGRVETQVREAFEMSGVTKKSDLIKYKIDEQDKETILTYWNDLLKTPQS